MQSAQYPLIKEYSLNHNMTPLIFKVYSVIKGYWAPWEEHEFWMLVSDAVDSTEAEN